MPFADWLAMGVAVALPWSTSATGIFIALWLVVAFATMDLAALKRELVTAAGGLPVLLCCLGAFGTLWADVNWPARLGGLDGYVRLLMIPLLLMQFRRSRDGRSVACGFFISASLVLVASFFMILTPHLDWSRHIHGVPVHDDQFQGSAFLICGFGALGYVILKGARLDRRLASALFVIGTLFLVNFAFVVISRAAVLVAPILTVLLGWRIYRWKGVFGAAALGAAIASLALLSSPSLRERMNESIGEFQTYRATNAATSIGEHIAFLKESFAIVASAPLIGHGTGSIPQQFREITAGKTGVSAEATVNPHNQTFAVAIQIGALGAIVLWAMWAAHFWLFREASAIAWLGMVMVAENIVSSAFHSHLFDFNNGWMYVFGIGVLGGTVLGERDATSVKRAAAPDHADQFGSASSRR
jgi:hypothetical protein